MEPPSPSPSSNTIMVAVDGSRYSDVAFNVCLALQKKNEKVLVYHVYDSSKTLTQQQQLLASYYGYEHLELECVSKCMEKNCTNYQIICQDRALSQSQSTSKMILQYAQENNVNTLVMGSVGRKGPSVWGNSSKTNLLHDTWPGLSVVTAKINSRVNFDPRHPQTFVVGMDGSNKSFKALAWAMRRVRFKNDKIVVVHVRNEERESVQGFNPLEEIGERVKTQIGSGEITRKKNIHYEIVYEPRDRLIRLSAQIIQYAKKYDADYVVVGKDGVKAMERCEEMQCGTVTDSITKKGRMTTIVVS
jgi:nucleotide-binding universal stress UspA family protein